MSVTHSATVRGEPAIYAGIRMNARLDQATRQKVDDLARHFHTPRAVVLCHIMHWGLSHQQTEPLDHGESQGPVRYLHLYVPSDLLEQVEKASIAAGLKTDAWLRHKVRQITIEDFPTSWHMKVQERRGQQPRR